MKVRFKEFALASSAAGFASGLGANLINICYANRKWVVWYKEPAE